MPVYSGRQNRYGGRRPKDQCPWLPTNGLRRGGTIRHKMPRHHARRRFPEYPAGSFRTPVQSSASARRCREARNRNHPAGRKVMVVIRSEEHTSELQSLMRISYAVFCLQKKKTKKHTNK